MQARHEGGSSHDRTRRPPEVGAGQRIIASPAHQLTPAALAKVLAALIRYPWPGNVRELQNVVVERAVILSQDGILRPMLPEWPRSSEPSPTGGTMLEDAQREYILQALRDMRWVIGGPQGAAARLGIVRQAP